MVCTKRWDSNFFGVGLQLFWSGTPTFSSGTPTFCQMGVLNSCFQNPSESSGPLYISRVINLIFKNLYILCLKNSVDPDQIPH